LESETLAEFKLKATHHGKGKEVFLKLLLKSFDANVDVQALQQKISKLAIENNDLKRRLVLLQRTPELKKNTSQVVSDVRKQRRTSTSLMLEGMKSIHGSDLPSLAIGYSDYFLKNRELYSNILDQMEKDSNLAKVTEARVLQQHSIPLDSALELLDSANGSVNVTGLRRLYALSVISLSFFFPKFFLLFFFPIFLILTSFFLPFFSLFFPFFLSFLSFFSFFLSFLSFFSFLFLFFLLFSS